MGSFPPGKPEARETGAIRFSTARLMVRAGHAGQHRAAGSPATTVLLVEEDPVVRKSLMRALASEGFAIQGADPGAMMEAALERQAYHAVLVSVEGGAGALDEEVEAPMTAAPPGNRRRAATPDWSRIQRVRRLHPAGRLVVLTVTASSLPGDSYGLEGVDALVEKPVAVATLVALLREMLEGSGSGPRLDSHTC